MFNGIVFYTAFALILLFLISALCCKNIFYSLMSAIMVFFLTSVFFFLLGSEYNAIMQIAVYGFAVPVILGIGIMFTNMKDKVKTKHSSTNSSYTVFLIGGLFILALVYLFMTSYIVVPDDFIINNAPNTALNTYDNISIFAKGIFVKYVWAFELVSIILTIIVAGISIVSKRYGGSK